MKKSALGIYLIIFSGLIFFTMGVLSAADIPDDVTVENQGYKKNQKGSVHLSHKKHSTEYNVACTDCHHEYKDGKNIWKEGDPVKKCVDCHNPEKSEGNIKKLQLAFHSNCKDCHKEPNKAGKKNGPTTKCNDCHAKE
ncbi:MAG: cytochrome c3 family protein [Deltaproteobacteria bacterium]|nr:cytochrome c3 family protein [Deltaproteobacteria bacterium]